jgi:hypothetical protein
VQTEIEQAIHNYILSQINLRENQQVDIDLQATRGEAGFRATIDIRTVTGPTPEVVRAEAPVTMKGPRVATVSSVVRTSAAEVRAMMEAESAAGDSTTNEVAAQEVAAVVEAVEAVPLPTAATPAQEGVAEEAPPARSSLFKGLKRLGNS